MSDFGKVMDELILSCRKNIYPELAEGEEPIINDDYFPIVLLMDVHEFTFNSRDVLELGRIVDSRRTILYVHPHMPAEELQALAKSRMRRHFEVVEPFPKVTPGLHRGSVVTWCDEEHIFEVLTILEGRVKNGEIAELKAQLLSTMIKEGEGEAS